MASVLPRRFFSSSLKSLTKTAVATSTPSVAQAPNRAEVWSESQNPRSAAIENNPRFEQTSFEFQPKPLSAMELIAEEPIRLVQDNIAVCDGGNGSLGHPKVFINLDKAGPHPCGYCGIRYEQDPHHHHHH